MSDDWDVKLVSLCLGAFLLIIMAGVAGLIYLFASCYHSGDRNSMSCFIVKGHTVDDAKIKQ